MSELRDSDSAASHALLAAALTGLLCLAGCGGGAEDDPAALACAEGPVDNPQITSSETIADLSEAKFRADCDRQRGTVEVHPHCGGVNSCRGFSYDSDTDVFTEHTCRGTNTCTGYSCVVCD